MAITIKQYPAAESLDVSQSTYPVYYTCVSDQYTYEDFRYVFKFYTENGIVSTSKNPPYITDAVGVYDATSILNRYVYFSCDPEIITWDTPAGAIQNYRIVVEESSDSIGSPDTGIFSKNIGINCHQEDFDWTDYQLNLNTKKFLSKLETTQTLELGLDEPATLRALTGMLQPEITASRSYFYEIVVEVIDANDGYLRTYRYITANPYYNATTIQGPSANNSTIEDMTGYVLDIPAGPKNINQMWWSYVAITSGGSWYPLIPPKSVSNIVDVGDTYTVQSYTWPQGSNGRTSQKYNYKVVDYCANRNPVELCWENELGGPDYFSFTKVRAKKQKIDRTTFRKNRDSVGRNTDYWMGHTDYDKGETNFHNNITTTYMLNSDWLINPEWNYLEDLWLSKNVLALIDGTWYPVILNADDMLIETDAKGLRQYSFEIRLANKTYR